MNPPSVRPALPADVLFAVLGHLPPADVRRAAAANSHLRAAAQPYVYRRGALTGSGPYFRGAPEPTPFLAGAGAGRRRAHVAQLVHLLELAPHASEECRGSPLALGSLALALPVLRVRLGDASSSRSGSQSQERSIHTDVGPDDAPAPYTKCLYLESNYHALAVGTLVVRGFPLWDEGAVVPAHKPQRFVAVLDGEAPHGEYWHQYASSNRAGSDAGSDEERRDYVSVEDDMFSPDWIVADDMTFVFWTGAPQDEWVPPRNRSLPPAQQLAYPLDISAHIWRRLARSVAPFPPTPYYRKLPRLRRRPNLRLRIVNAAAVIPPGMQRERHRQSLADGTATSRAAEEILEDEFGDGKDIKFLTMEEWIAAEQWEDVFTEAEIAPWLEKRGAREA